MIEIEKFASELVFSHGDSYSSSSRYGDDSNYGDGYGDSSGYGDGSGSSGGYGHYNGSGSGDGYGYEIEGDIKSFNRFPVYFIDGIQTGIMSAKGNVAKGFVLCSDLTMNPCYIVKDNNGIYAHGKTLKEAQEALRAKQLEEMPIEERIQLFKEHFESDRLYKGQEFYDWHHILTGSCKMGRDNFCEEHKIDLKAKYTVKDFIKLTENSYGGDIIKKLRRIYEQ